MTGVQTCALPISPKPQNPKTPIGKYHIALIISDKRKDNKMEYFEHLVKQWKGYRRFKLICEAKEEEKEEPFNGNSFYSKSNDVNSVKKRNFSSFDFNNAGQSQSKNINLFDSFVILVIIDK